MLHCSDFEGRCPALLIETCQRLRILAVDQFFLVFLAQLAGAFDEQFAEEAVLRFLIVA